jgi:ABC-type phosphate transport system substrate-binding protein
MRARRTLLLALALMAPIALLLGDATAAPPPVYVVIVHPSNPTASVDRKFLEEAFLKKTTRWDHGEVIRPVDQVPDSPVRRQFSDEVLRRSVAAVRSYWQQMIFSGRDVPPPELTSDEEVVKYVLKYPGAVGYVSGSADSNGAKIVSVN